jgi:hypothetical protein
MEDTKAGDVQAGAALVRTKTELVYDAIQQKADVISNFGDEVRYIITSDLTDVSKFLDIDQRCRRMIALLGSLKSDAYEGLYLERARKRAEERMLAGQ